MTDVALDAEALDDAAAPGLGRFCLSLARYFGPHKVKVAAVLAASTFETGFYWVVPLAFRYLIDHTFGEADRNGLLAVLVLLGAGVAGASLASLWRGRYWARVGSQVVADLRFQLFHKLQQLSSSAYAKTTTGALLSRFSNDLAAVDNALTIAVVWGVLPGIDCVLGTIILLVLDWRLGLLAALVWPWCILMPSRIARRAAPAADIRKQRESDLLEIIHEEVATHAVVRAYGLQKLSLMRFFQGEAALYESSVESAYLTALMDQSAISGILLLQVLTLGFGAWLAFNGYVSIGTLAAFQALFLGVSTSLLYFTQYLRSLLPARAGMHRIELFLAQPVQVDDAPHATTLAPFTTDIAFDDVCFAYDGTPVLDHVSFRIPRGTSVAIVGPSGSGKSTVMSLLLRFHDPLSGRVLVDGVDLKAVTQASWRTQLGVVFQENLLFRTTLRENIRMGRPDATDDEVQQAARQAGIHDTLMQQPAGYDTQAGERGGRLSGGQRQRLAIARALVRQPRVLLLDEATSALDPQTETEVNATVKQAGSGRTVIAVTHRLTSVTDVNLILVMERGRLVEQGTHDELLRRGGVYAALWQRAQQEAP